LEEKYLKYLYDSLDVRAEKTPAPKVPKKAGPTELGEALAYLKNTKAFEGLSDLEYKSASVDIANEINSIQQKAANAKEEVPSYEAAREEAASKIMSRVGRIKGTIWGTNPKYFSKPEDILAAVKNKSLPATDAEELLKNGFPDFYEKHK